MHGVKDSVLGSQTAVSASYATEGPSGAQSLAVIKSSDHMLETKIDAISLVVNLLRTDLGKVSERSIQN